MVDIFEHQNGRIAAMTVVIGLEGDKQVFLSVVLFQNIGVLCGGNAVVNQQHSLGPAVAPVTLTVWKEVDFPGKSVIIL